jgi:hypothetical protein
MVSYLQSGPSPRILFVKYVNGALLLYANVERVSTRPVDAIVRLPSASLANAVAETAN